MKKIKHVLRDTDIQSFIGNQLRFGVMLSIAVALIGGVIYLIANGNNPTPDYTQFVTEPSQYTTLTGIFHGVLHLSAQEIIQLGVVILIATPTLRVFFCIIAFAMEKDLMYVIITTIVLAIILANIYYGVK